MKKMIAISFSGLLFLSSCSHQKHYASQPVTGEDQFVQVPFRMKNAEGVEEPVPFRMGTGPNGRLEQVPTYMRGQARDVASAERTDWVAREGQAVQMANVRVQKVDSDYTFWVGSTKGNTIPVVLNREKINLDPERRVEVREGQVLQIAGVWKKTSNSVNDLKLTKAQRRAFLSQPYFVSANRVYGPAVTGE